MNISHRLPLLTAFCAAIALPLMAADWTQWGGHNDRNQVCDEKGLPDSFVPGEKKTDGSGIDMATTKNVKWVTRLGSATYGNPTVAKGRVFVGTDDFGIADDPRFQRSKGGMVRCYEEATGKLLWQLEVPKRTELPEGLLYGQQHLGTCSSPTVDVDRVYVVTSAAEVLCLDARGAANGNAGPFKDEGQYMAGTGKPPITLGSKDGDIIWRVDMMKELAVRPHDVASCSVLIIGDFLYTSTSNGVDKPHAQVVNPQAPALIVLDKRTGRLVATEGNGLSERIHHAEWSPPSAGKVGDKMLVFHGGGDGVCYAFEALTKMPKEPVKLKEVWSYDCNPPHYKFRDGKPIPLYEGDKRKKTSPNTNDGTYVGPSEIIATPVFYKNRVYVGIGQDPAHGRGKGMFHCIDATKTGDITKTGCIWSYDGLDRTIATAAVHDRLVYITDISGRLHCLDADTGKCYWVYETNAETWGGVLVADGKLYLATKNAFYIMAAGKEAKVLSKINLGSPSYCTAVVANGVLYVASQSYLWAVQQPHDAK